MSGRAKVDKGKRRERELVAVLRRWGWSAQRSGFHQAQAGSESPDVESELPIHWEVKGQEKSRVLEWLRQAEAASDGRAPVVAWKKSREDWVAILRLDALLDLLKGDEM